MPHILHVEAFRALGETAQQGQKARITDGPAKTIAAHLFVSFPLATGCTVHEGEVRTTLSGSRTGRPVSRDEVFLTV